MISFISGRRGSIGLGFVIMGSIVSLVIIGIIAIFMYLVNSSFFDEFNATGFADENTAKVENSIMGAIKMMDWIMVLLFIFTLVGAGVYGYRNPESIVNFLTIFLVAPFLGFVSYIFNYIFFQIVMDSAFASVVEYFPNTIIICTNLHWIALAQVVVGGYAIYTARRQIAQ